MMTIIASNILWNVTIYCQQVLAAGTITARVCNRGSIGFGEDFIMEYTYVL